MKKFISLIMMAFLISSIQTVTAQEVQNSNTIYNPQANAGEEISQAIQKAKAEGKHVLVQVGGNWCSWCRLFHKFINEDPEIKKYLGDNYVFILLNYSKENKNADLMAKYKYPGRMGYPVFLILDGKGQLIHTQDSGLLEEGQGYSKAKVLTFLKNWTRKALDPATYEE
jgi:thioredoxin-related protein